MAFSFGFFSSKNLDRTYTAENFNEYLSSIICDGIQDTYGAAFRPTANKLQLTIGSGKAWIDGHYFIFLLTAKLLMILFRTIFTHQYLTETDTNRSSGGLTAVSLFHI